MPVNVPGLLIMLLFYAVVLLTGVLAARKAKRQEQRCSGKKSEIALVGGRDINVVVGVFTMTATWIGSGYILGTAEAVYMPNRGLLWALGPPSYVVTFILGALFFTKPMRSQCYVTMMDPFEKRYGNMFTTILLIPVIVSDVVWVASVLGALGGTLNVILDLSSSYTILISSAVAIIYTLLGGLYSVAHTDIIQLLFFFFSLWFCVPFILTNPATTNFAAQVVSNQTHTISWLGELKLEDAGKWLDEFGVLSLGALAYQALYQRILSASSTAQAQLTCVIASVLCVIIGIPSVIIGITAHCADWNQTAYGLPTPLERGQAGKVLPLVLQYLCPSWVAMFGIGGVAAAVMSSVDSAMLSAASMFSKNIYKGLLRKTASENEVVWAIRVSILVVGLAGTGLAFLHNSIMAFWLLGSDLIYVVVFPELVCVLHCPMANGYGASAGYVTGLLLRFLSGEPFLRLPAVIHYPWWREKDGVVEQLFPFRTFIMLLVMVNIVLFSWLSQYGFSQGLLPQGWDVFGVLKKRKDMGRNTRTQIQNSKRTAMETPVPADKLLGTSTC